MRFLLPPRHLQPTLELLEAMPLAASASRARTKLVHLLKAAYACGSPQIVEGLRLRGVRDGRRGGLLVIDR
ncbi:hypothetical protein V7F78_02425, partial [Cutibacterium avidum]